MAASSSASWAAASRRGACRRPAQGSGGSWLACHRRRLGGPHVPWHCGPAELASLDTPMRCLRPPPLCARWWSPPTPASGCFCSPRLARRRRSSPPVGLREPFTAEEQAYPPHVLALLAAVHIWYYIPCSCSTTTSWVAAPPARRRAAGVLSDLTVTLRTDNQAVSWLRMKRYINRFLACWLDEIEEFRFDVEESQVAITRQTR